ncbi:MAG: winged helix-turn-helix domain-containing protein [Thermoplasmata archaeon]|nr:MAG: winged helix-turn-helix domain-containing protein [Thermoplasmata archaeon]
MNDKKQDIIYKIFRLLRENVIKILMAIRENEKIKWKELQEITKLSTATFNRALSALKEMHFIKKERNFYKLTWTGKLVTDGLLLLGWRMAEEMEEVEDFVAEELLAKDIVMAVIVLLFVSIKRRGKLNIEIFEKEMEKEMEILKDILKEYEKDGYIEIKDGWVYAKKKMDEFDISKIFP